MSEQPELFPPPAASFDGAAATPRRRAARQKALATITAKAADSFQNFSLNLGLGTDNALTGSTYGFNPITRIRTLLEWIYRGNWIGAVAVDLVADDMTRAGVEILTELPPEDIEKIQRTATSLGVWNSINDCEKWARLYGGAIAVLLVDGQDMATPLREDTVRPGQFRGLAVFDRWSVTPSSNLVQELGPHLGLPDFYVIGQDAPGLRGQRVHYTRVLRLVGIELPWNQRVAENMWGLSIVERLYDRMVAFDSATQGAAQLVYRVANRTYKLDGMRQLVGAGADAVQMLARYMDATRKFAGIEGITIIDAKDDMVTTQLNVQSGISDALERFGEQISGATQIPLVRLFGQSPGGLNSDGDSNLRTYYDNIANQQNKELREPLLTIYRLIARSIGKKPDAKFNIAFNALWQMTDVQKSEVAERDARSVADLESAGILPKPIALRELRQSGRLTGRFSNITDETIKEAEEEPPPSPEELMLGAAAAREPLLLEDKREKADRREKVGDSLPMREFRGFQIMVETPKGGVRRGNGWAVEMPEDYGFIRGTSSAEGAFEQMDCFLGPDHGMFVVDAATPEGAFDEHKVMLGFADAEAAEACFRAAYHDARRPMGVTEVDAAGLRRWLDAGDVTRPMSDRPPLRAVR